MVSTADSSKPTTICNKRDICFSRPSIRPFPSRVKSASVNDVLYNTEIALGEDSGDSENMV